MSRPSARGALVLAALALAACASPDGKQGVTPEEVLLPPPSSDLPLPERDISRAPNAPAGGNLAPADRAPLVYLAVGRGADGVVEVIFVMDRARDGTPENDPAARLRPADGQCNLDDIPVHDIGAGAAPIFGPDVAANGVTPDQLPAFMAIMVSEEMLARGLAAQPGDTQPQNVCTRKYWERLVAQTAPG